MKSGRLIALQFFFVCFFKGCAYVQVCNQRCSSRDWWALDAPLAAALCSLMEPIDV